MKVTAVMSTIGAPFALDALASLPPFDEVLVVVDMVGRSCSALDREFPLDEFVRAAHGIRHLTVGFLQYAPAPGAWAVHNGSYNVGTRAAKNDWLVYTHDDTSWPAHDFVGVLGRALSWAEARGRLADGRPIVGAILPIWEVEAGCLVPEFSLDRPALCQCVSPVSQVLHRSAWAAIGGFDEEFGVWYDGQLEQEARLRDWRFVYLPTPPVRHQSNRTYKINNWGNAWAPNPKWANYQQNFERKFGIPPYPRKLAEWDPQPLDIGWTAA